MSVGGAGMGGPGSGARTQMFTILEIIWLNKKKKEASWVLGISRLQTTMYQILIIRKKWFIHSENYRTFFKIDKWVDHQLDFGWFYEAIVWIKVWVLYLSRKRKQRQAVLAEEETVLMQNLKSSKQRKVVQAFTIWVDVGP